MYKHTTPSGKIYIGITQQRPEARWLCGHGYKSNTHFYKAIKKYGWNNITHEIIKEGLTQTQAEDLEKKLILKYKSHDKDRGYNKALGGHALSVESRKKIGTTRRARGYTSWTKGKHLSEETKAKISRANTGKRHTLSDEARKNIAAAKTGDKNPNYGKPMPESKKRKLVAINSKPVLQIIDGKEIRYKSVKDAGVKTGVSACNITRVCKGQRQSAGGFRWKYAASCCPR